MAVLPVMDVPIRSDWAVPVKGCRNAMVVFDTASFYESGLLFRGVPDSLAGRHVEGSECCIIHAHNQLAEKGVWMNPQVRVGYSAAAYYSMNGPSPWVSFSHLIRGSWGNWIRRWSTTIWFKKHIVRWRLAGWHKENPDKTGPASDSLVNEVRVLTANGWAHV